MQIQAKPTEVEKVAVNKQDFVNGWLVLEKLAVSLHKIGSAYATRTAEEFTEERRQQMYAEVGRFVVQKVFEDANRFRIPLGDCLPDEEAEALSDQVEYWEAAKH